jgi:hypothetical protein
MRDTPLDNNLFTPYIRTCLADFGGKTFRKMCCFNLENRISITNNNILMTLRETATVDSDKTSKPTN